MPTGMDDRALDDLESDFSDEEDDSNHFRVASKILLQAASTKNFHACWSRYYVVYPGPPPSEPSSPSGLIFSFVAIWQPPNHRNRTTMGADGSGAAGALDPHDCEAAHYVVTNHRPGSVHLTARCSFLGPDTQVRKVGKDIIGMAGRPVGLHLLAANKCGDGISSFWLAIELRLICSDV